jgi:hypothetical protein
MHHDVARPCGASDLVNRTPEYAGGWGPALDFAPIPWCEYALGLGFDYADTVRSDSDWDRIIRDQNADESLIGLRYVLVPLDNGWELRLGRTKRGTDLKTSGSHRHMFSDGEERIAKQLGQGIRSGYIYEVENDRIVVD